MKLSQKMEERYAVKSVDDPFLAKAQCMKWLANRKKLHFVHFFWAKSRKKDRTTAIVVHRNSSPMSKTAQLPFKKAVRVPKPLSKSVLLRLSNSFQLGFPFILLQRWWSKQLFLTYTSTSFNNIRPAGNGNFLQVMGRNNFSYLWCSSHPLHC